MPYHDYYSNDLEGAAYAEQCRQKDEEYDDTPTLADCMDAEEQTDEDRQAARDAQDWQETMDSLRYDFR